MDKIYGRHKRGKAVTLDMLRSNAEINLQNNVTAQIIRFLKGTW